MPLAIARFKAAPLEDEEEEMLSTTAGETSSGTIITDNQRKAEQEKKEDDEFVKSVTSWRLPACCTVAVFVLVILFYLFQVGKSSRHSLAMREPETPIRAEANRLVTELNRRLASAGVHDPIIISTLGGSERNLKPIVSALRELGIAIPVQRIDLKPIMVHTEKVGLKRVLASVLTWEHGVKFTESTVAEFASLAEWNLGRAFVASYLNSTIPSNGQKLWAFAHPRAGYLLPLFQSVLGLEKFRFVHIISNGMDITWRHTAADNREYKWTCPLIMPNAQCENTRDNRVNFWAEINHQVFGWCKRLDVDRYIAFRSEDFAEEKCLQRLVGALRLPEASQDVLLRARQAATGAFASANRNVPPRNITVSDDAEAALIASRSAVVRKQLKVWKYPLASTEKRGDCESYPL